MMKVLFFLSAMLVSICGCASMHDAYTELESGPKLPINGSVISVRGFDA
jgi:hypothetical protein